MMVTWYNISKQLSWWMKVKSLLDGAGWVCFAKVQMSSNFRARSNGYKRPLRTHNVACSPGCRSRAIRLTNMWWANLKRDCILLPTGHPGDDPIVWLTTIKFSLNVKTKGGTILFVGGVLQDVVLQHWDIHFALALFSSTASQDLTAVMQSRSDAHPYKLDSLPSLLIITFKHLFWPIAQVTFLALILLHSSMLPLHWKHLKAKPVGECSTLVSRY